MHINYNKLFLKNKKILHLGIFLSSEAEPLTAISTESPYTRPHSLDGTNHCKAIAPGKQQNPSKGAVISQISASDSNPVGFYCNIMSGLYLGIKLYLLSAI